MRPQSFDVLLNWILKELEQRESIFGIHRSLFWVPGKDNHLATPNMFGQVLATPIGPAAGPHTQLAQNIVCAWLSGGRFIELKTVQMLDNLEIPRPCIDMEDEGYNVEWSQELKLNQSADEYIKAWVLIHILHRLLGLEGQAPLGTIFNLSVGYNLEGIRSASMIRFLDQMKDASEKLDEIRTVLRKQFPRFADIEIPAQLSNNVTLSTMHGCPPEEIERIARYLLEERGLHTTVKLNPTLLGKDRVLGILHDDLGFREIRVPDAVFEHDLKYDRAVELIKSLRQAAAKRNLTFGIKLSNTLATANHKANLPGSEMYMSGRALYPLTMSLFHKLAAEFHGDLKVSYSGGADALNVAAILASGARPVTVASDLLKPGGYSRLLQYLENLNAEMRSRAVANLDKLAQNKLANLERAAIDALTNPRYKKTYQSDPLPKVSSGLGLFDCVTAPCMEQCAVCQDVPEYAWLIAQGEYDRALEVILSRNPLPGVTGYVCTHLCQSRCTRTASNYDEPVAIRALKRFAAEKGRVALPVEQQLGRKVAIMGSGPSGLSAAYFLALNGIQATIFEARNEAGGMMRLAPVFRLPTSVIQEDVDRIAGMGVDIKLSHPVTRPPEELLNDGFDVVYVASGFQKDAPLFIEGMEGEGMVPALDLLRRVRHGNPVELGPRVLVIGGGDTAMDAARVAHRLTGNPVTVVYRRTREEMPATEEDKQGAFEEGIILRELVSPARVIRTAGRVTALECIRNRPGEPGADGRRRPVPIEGSEFQIEADSIIVAVGQSPDLTFLNGSAIRLDRDGSIAVSPETGLAGLPRVYAGGDVVGGPESIIAACADGRRAAEAICAEFGIQFEQLPSRPAKLSAEEITRVKRLRTRKEAQQKPETVSPAQRSGFELIEATLSEEAARNEASRCLQCSVFCDKCVEVCPNRANYTYDVSPEPLNLPVLNCRNGVLAVKGTSVFQVGQTRQIIHLHDLCNDCGNCATFCVHEGKPYRDKPRLFFNRGDFERESDNAFHIERAKEYWIIRRREGGKESQLVLGEGATELVFENDLLRVVMSGADFRVRTMDLKKPFQGELTLVEPAEMFVILKGVRTSLPFLVTWCPGG
jgi:putative selenate reductase